MLICLDDITIKLIKVAGEKYKMHYLYCATGNTKIISILHFLKWNAFLQNIYLVIE